MSQAVQDNATLHSRLDVLEKELVELRNRVIGIKPPWLSAHDARYLKCHQADSQATA